MPREDQGVTYSAFSEEYEAKGNPSGVVVLRGDDDSSNEVASEFAHLKVYRGFLTEAEVNEPCMVSEFPQDPEDVCWGDA